MRIIWIAALLLITCSGCYNDKYDKLYPSPIDSLNTATCDTSGTITYSGTIKPIIEANCYSPGNGCHDAAGSTVSQYNYEIFSVLQGNALNGQLVGCVSWASGYVKMPLGGNQISSCDINEITRWVNEGAPNN